MEGSKLERNVPSVVILSVSKGGNSNGRCTDAESRSTRAACVQNAVLGQALQGLWLFGGPRLQPTSPIGRAGPVSILSFD